MATTLQKPLPINISADHLRAELLPAKADPLDITTENVLAQLKERGIFVTEEVQAKVEELTNRVHTGEAGRGPFLLAEGQAPVAGKGASVELAATKADDENAEDSELNRVDFHECRITIVQEGDAIGTYTEEVLGTPGVDVFGKPIAPSRPAASITIGQNIRLGEDSQTLIATIAGKVQIDRNEISVINVIDVAGDVDFSTGNIESPTDVLIEGTVRDTFAVRSARSVAVRGAIEAATVEAGTDVQVAGGIAGRRQGSIIAGQGIAVRFCGEAHLRAEGDINIAREAMNCNIYCCGHLSMPRGKIVGGYTYAREGAEVKMLGNEANRKTILAVGIDPEAFIEAAEMDNIIKKKKAAAVKIREKLQPLMAQLKRLTAQQREQATELMYEADGLDAQILEHEQQKKKAIASRSPRKPAIVLVTSVVHPGVRVVFGDKVTAFHEERKGPIRIERRLVGRIEEICVIDRCSGSVTVVPSYRYSPQMASDDEGPVAG